MASTSTVLFFIVLQLTQNIYFSAACKVYCCAHESKFTGTAAGAESSIPEAEGPQPTDAPRQEEKKSEEDLKYEYMKYFLFGAGVGTALVLVPPLLPAVGLKSAATYAALQGSSVGLGSTAGLGSTVGLAVASATSSVSSLFPFFTKETKSSNLPILHGCMCCS
ncbi:uncharacterized protein LOC129964292 isoform X1 [Argiope bruennichi]|uniref:Uncharacterized protein n=1 Tax=Argiope bruennichi TaxID=94029 RepID=A0A8T0F2E2_ARGBR|nr:uncharacterized protein LOC129964292 isoform X1 [Argiope bruennichi]KAF8783088.1 hypothetical protein HNY73_013298 [Argiope bruennichi]